MNHPIVGVVNRKGLPIYSTWQSMLARCYNPKHWAYHRYGGLGVTVCEEWLDFQTFARWYNANHVEGWSMDKDCLGGVIYGPETCIYVPEQINQTLRGCCNPSICVGKYTNTWFVRTKNVDGEDHYKGKFRSKEEAVEYAGQYLRQKMKDLVVKYSIPAATAHKLISL